MMSSKAHRCGDMHDGRESGIGCKEVFAWDGEAYRCVDCDVYMHRHCMRKHFALSSMENLMPLVKLLRASLRINGLDDSGKPMNTLTAVPHGKTEK